VAVFAFTAPAVAQGVVAGTVIDAGSRAPIAGAQVSIDNTTLGALTDASGRFRIGGAREGARVTVVARRIGYAAERRTVTVSDTTVAFELTARATNLDVVVVTGTPTGQAKREIGNAVTTIDVAEVQRVAPVQSFQQLVNGRAPNVTIMPGTGEIGSGAKIRVRGTSSLGLTQTPLIYVDGVRMNNDQATGPANQAFGSASISRWNDIDPEDIERIEILKGPSAATLYGTEAANGVIQIFTKQGAAGGTRFNFTLRQGTNFIMNPEGRWPTNYGIVDGEVRTIDFRTLNSAYRRAYGTDIFRSGHAQLFQGSISGGTDQLQYYVSGAREANQGVDPTNDLGRTSARVNLAAQPNEKFRVQTHVNFTTGKINLAPEAGYGGRVWTTILMDPKSTTDPEQLGFYSGLPWQYDAAYHMSQNISRFTGSVQLNHQPTPWLSHRIIVGADQVNTMDVELAPRIDSLLTTAIGDDALGFIVQTNNTDAFRTFDYAATARVNVRPELSLATSVGAQYYTKRYEYVFGSGSVFPAPGLTSVDATTVGRSTSQDVLENRTLGLYVQEQIGWKDRRYLTLAVRSDKNSAFGKSYGRAYYPKASVSWVISEEPFWRVGWLNSLRLRAAYGESGQQPNQFDALRTYLPVTGPNDNPAVMPLSLGNPNLGPERGEEREVGFEASLLRDRVGLELTYYDKRTTKAILDKEVAPSAGFALTQFVNAGEVKNTGVELLARVTPVSTPTVSWDAAFAFSHNKNRIVDLGVPGVSFLTAGTYMRHQTGYPVGAWFEKRVVSASLDGSGNAIDIMCDDGKGGQVDCASAPSVYLGSSIPSSQGAFTSTITLWGQFRIYGMVDFQRGQRKLDGNYRVRCFFKLGGVCREKIYPGEYSPILQAGIQNSYPFYLITDAGFAKLREVSVTYTLPDRFARSVRAGGVSVTLAGRNLHTWTKYKGLEPEAAFLSGSRGAGNVSWEQTTTPQLSSFLATVNISF
jgi:TonB-linked SusC/RagA family outer membrane protein